MTEQLLYTSLASFEAARCVTQAPAGHRFARLHGHGFQARVRTALIGGQVPFPGAEVSALRQRLTEAVAPLDYQSLNETLPEPSDLNLAHWLRERLALPGLDALGIQSTRQQGVDLNLAGQPHVWRRYVFESAHQLPNVPQGHKCGRMHGHSFEVILHAAQVPGADGRVLDYDQLDALWAPMAAELHYRCLNDIPGLENPTSEMLSSWIWRRLKPQLPALSWVTVFETASCGAHFDGARYRIWKDFTLDSAVRLVHAPEGDMRRRIHGHTFTLRLHLSAPLDQVMGWTVDFGDVKAVFNPIFAMLDHHPLHERADLADSDCASLARLIKAQTLPDLPQLSRIDLEESPGCGVILAWGDQVPAF